MAKKKSQSYWMNLVKNGKIQEKAQDPKAIAALTTDDMINITKAVATVHVGNVSRRVWTEVTGIGAGVVERIFGTFGALKSESGLSATPGQRKLHNATAKHVMSDKVKAVGIDRQNWGRDYTKPTDSRYKTVVIGTDFHDVECDPFALRVFVDTLKRIQPDSVCLGGDLFDIPEFSSYFCDPREWDAAGRIKFAHDKILTPIREAAPNAEMDLIEGNHEARLLKSLCDNDPALMDILHNLHGMTLKDIFGLDKFEVNYIAKSDLHTWKKSDERKAVSKNWKCYYDSFIVCHFPEARMKSGMPGVHGHHHKHISWSHYNHTFGQYEWHQLGGMHYRDASYADGQIWSNGFMIAHVDTKTKKTLFEYVDIKDYACVGGQYYVRGRNEHTLGGWNKH